MVNAVKIARVTTALETLEYPVTRTAAAKAFDGTTLDMADGKADLGDLIRETGPESFDSAEDLTTELHNVVPIEAVGEPGQSDGDA